MSRYDDIIKLSRPNNNRHPKMDMASRAAQFSPFAALTGFESLIIEQGRDTSELLELDETVKLYISDQLNYLNEHRSIPFEITYFVPDSLKEGGRYLKTMGTLKKIDVSNNQICLSGGLFIEIPHILRIDLLQEDLC